jgi:DNA-binding transcriptional regulator YhcF (GntR family)
MEKIVISVSVAEAFTYHAKKRVGHFASSLDDRIFVIPKLPEGQNKEQFTISFIVETLLQEFDLYQYTVEIVVKKNSHVEAYKGNEVVVRQAEQTLERDARKEVATRLREYVDNCITNPYTEIFVSAAHSSNHSAWVSLRCNPEGEVYYDYDYVNGSIPLLELESVAAVETFSQYIPKKNIVNIYYNSHGVNKLHANLAFQRAKTFYDTNYLSEKRTGLILSNMRHYYINKSLKCTWIRWVDVEDLKKTSKIATVLAKQIVEQLDKGILEEELDDFVWNYLRAQLSRRQIIEAEDSRFISEKL